MYINGHFCYAYKFGIVTNGLGIVRDITFYNKEFLKAHPDIVVEKKSDSPDEDKSLADSKALLPVLIDFFQKHPLIAPKTFLGDAAFDTIEIYKALFGEIGFEKAFIPLRVKLSMEDNGYTINENGVPCCPHDPSLPMKREGSKSHLKSKIPTMKFVCPKMKWEYNKADKTKRRVSLNHFVTVPNIKILLLFSYEIHISNFTLTCTLRCPCDAIFAPYSRFTIVHR